MPCNSDYLNPTEEEANRKLVCELLIFVNGKIRAKTDKKIIDAAKHAYGDGVELNAVVVQLCDRLSALSTKQKNSIIYNGKNETSRKLADWWDEHVKADKNRVHAEMQEAKDAKARKKALSKLSVHERKLLGL